MKKTKVEEVKITVKCVGCGFKKVVGREQKDLPMCPQCYAPMFAERAEFKKGR